MESRRVRETVFLLVALIGATAFLLGDSLAAADPPRVCACMDRQALDPDRDPGSEPRGQALSLVYQSERKWPNKQVTIGFLGGSEELQRRVRAAAEGWLPHVSLQFRWVVASEADVRITFIQNGRSESLVGTDALSVRDRNQGTMNFGWLTDESLDFEIRSVVLHEFGHMLGFVHEHQSPAGGIAWNRDEVYKAYSGPPNNWSREKIDSEVLNSLAASQTQFTELDPSSIMMYPIPAILTTNGFSAGWNTELSAMDRDFAGRIYPPSIYTASVRLPNRECLYCFRDGYYYRFSEKKGRLDKVGQIGRDGWKGVWPNPDASVLHPNGNVYFFRGAEYQRFNLKADRVDKVGRLGVDGWKGVWTTGIDAAVYHPILKNIYFFKGKEYQLFSIKEDQVTGKSPRVVGNDGWRALQLNHIDTAFTGPDNRVYFFGNGRFERYSFDRGDHVESRGLIGADGFPGL